MEIRKLTKDDAHAYFSIRLKALLENPEYYSSSYEEEKNRKIEMTMDRLSQENFITYGVFIEKILVGIITYAKESRIKTSHIADIYGMYVDSSYRRKGLAKALLNHVIKVANNDKIERIRLSVTKTNHAALQLYQSLGFVIYGTEPKSIKIDHQYFDAIYMNLDLES
jgi:ribosomal protein S18 acetylase RimI-like enzyme